MLFFLLMLILEGMYVYVGYWKYFFFLLRGVIKFDGEFMFVVNFVF